MPYPTQKPTSKNDVASQRSCVITGSAVGIYSRNHNNNDNNTQNYASYSICCTPLPGADPKDFHNAMQLAQQDCFGTYFLQLGGPFRPFNII
jgi:hypothetical protein